MTFGMQNIVEANQCIVVCGATPCQSTSVLINTTDTVTCRSPAGSTIQIQIKLLVS